MKFDTLCQGDYSSIFSVCVYYFKFIDIPNCFIFPNLILCATSRRISKIVTVMILSPKINKKTSNIKTIYLYMKYR